MEDNSLLQNRKPCFETSNSKVFVNLHNAAVEKAAKVLKLNPNDPNIGQFIINSGMTTDGRYVVGKLDSKDTKEVSKTFSSQKQQYEVGIVMQFFDYLIPTEDEIKSSNKILDIVNKKNEKALKTYRQTILNGLKEYFKWFSGQDIEDGDLVEFIPNYNGGKIEIDNGVIKSMEKKELEEYLTHRNKTLNESLGDDNNNENGKEKDNKKNGVENTFKPRIGFKVGYTITFEKSNKESKVENPNK